MVGDPSCPSSVQAMNIREQIGYPDYILEESNRHLDEEYSNVRTLGHAPALNPWRGGSPCQASFCAFSCSLKLTSTP